jgi:hypothetical protein
MRVIGNSGSSSPTACMFENGRGLIACYQPGLLYLAQLCMFFDVIAVPRDHVQIVCTKNQESTTVIPNTLSIVSISFSPVKLIARKGGQCLGLQ